MGIEVRHITKTFGAFAALRDVSLSVARGELVALLGPSGSGKTTLLRIIAGLETPDPAEGSGLFFHDKDIARRPVRDRGVGFVFQHYALFRHMSVFENVAFGLRVKPRRTRPSRQEIHNRVLSLLKLVQLDSMAGRYPSQLSGGQRQRVALARALAVEPQVLLLDEPFGALDAKVRLELRQWLRRLHDELHVTSVFVTHDQEEALEVADRVVVMNEGRIVQVGSAEEVFHHPADEFVMNFLGNVNVFHGRVQNGRAQLGPLQLECTEHASSQPVAARAFVRPYELDVDDHANGQPCFPAVVQHINAAGPRVKLTLTTGDETPLHAEISLERLHLLNLRPGMTVYVSPRDVRMFLDAAQPNVHTWSADRPIHVEFEPPRLERR
ncbi:MAG TPA: sulfate/molybdate ABC transporter ATP-binding protein [Phycisphaerae bacterium]|nr:sulfate/molybdate ABC transporter ATP-binding protein [Phycisphaerae bacterium]